jgi:hypothetical protein
VLKGIDVIGFELIVRKEFKHRTHECGAHRRRSQGAERDFSVVTKELRGEDGAVKKLVCVRLDANFKEIPATCGAANHSSYGRSARAARRRTPSTVLPR